MRCVWCKSAQVCLCLVVKVYICCSFSGGVLLQAYIAFHCTIFSILCSMYQLVVAALSVVLYCVSTMPLQQLLIVMNGSCVVMCGMNTFDQCAQRDEVNASALRDWSST